MRKRFSFLYAFVQFDVPRCDLLCLCLTQKALQMLFYSVFSFFPPRPVFWTDCQKFFRRSFKISYQVGMWSRFGLFLGNTKKCFHKNCYSSSLSCLHWEQKKKLGVVKKWKRTKHIVKILNWCEVLLGVIYDSFSLEFWWKHCTVTVEIT